MNSATIQTEAAQRGGHLPSSTNYSCLEMLEHNEDILAAMVENLQLGRFDQCMQHYGVLHQNLLKLAGDIDKFPTCEDEVHIYEQMGFFPDSLQRNDVLNELRPAEQLKAHQEHQLGGKYNQLLKPIIPACASCAAAKQSAEHCRRVRKHVDPSHKYSAAEREEFLRSTQVLGARHMELAQKQAKGGGSNGKRNYKRWKLSEHYTLLVAVNLFGTKDLLKLARIIPGRSESQIKNYIFHKFAADEKSADNPLSPEELLRRRPDGYQPPALLADFFAKYDKSLDNLDVGESRTSSRDKVVGNDTTTSAAGSNSPCDVTELVESTLDEINSVNWNALINIVANYDTLGDGQEDLERILDAVKEATIARNSNQTLSADGVTTGGSGYDVLPRVADQPNPAKSGNKNVTFTTLAPSNSIKTANAVVSTQNLVATTVAPVATAMSTLWTGSLMHPSSFGTAGAVAASHAALVTASGATLPVAITIPYNAPLPSIRDPRLEQFLPPPPVTAPASFTDPLRDMTRGQATATEQQRLQRILQAEQMQIDNIDNSDLGAPKIPLNATAEQLDELKKLAELKKMYQEKYERHLQHLQQQPQLQQQQQLHKSVSVSSASTGNDVNALPETEGENIGAHDHQQAIPPVQVTCNDMKSKARNKERIPPFAIPGMRKRKENMKQNAAKSCTTTTSVDASKVQVAGPSQCPSSQSRELPSQSAEMTLQCNSLTDSEVHAQQHFLDDIDITDHVDGDILHNIDSKLLADLGDE